MANITAKDVATLRAKTGIGMMECKKALVEADGDIDAAIKILREKGELKAESKMATRIAADGIVDVYTEGNTTAMIEVNSETDFVAKNASFQEFVKNLLKTIVANKPADVDALMASDYVDGSCTVEAKLKEQIFVIGEKLSIRRFMVIEGVTSTYIHGMGSIGVVTLFDTDCADKEGFEEFAKNISLQIGAYVTPYLDRTSKQATSFPSPASILPYCTPPATRWAAFAIKWAISSLPATRSLPTATAALIFSAAIFRSLCSLCAGCCA